MIVNSCVVPRHIKNTFIGCYDGTPTGIDTLLDLSGCFHTSSLVPFRNERLATNFYVLIFYNDGMVFRFGGVSSDPFYNVPARIQQKLYEAYPDRLRNGDWGLYELKDDIIKVQFIYRPNPPEKYDSYIVRYKVIDKHTIQEMLFNDIKETYNFMPIEKLPSSECWLKSEKWFWCDEELYKRHKQTSKSR